MCLALAVDIRHVTEDLKNGPHPWSYISSMCTSGLCIGWICNWYQVKMSILVHPYEKRIFFITIIVNTVFKTVILIISFNFIWLRQCHHLSVNKEFDILYIFGIIVLFLDAFWFSVSTVLLSHTNCGTNKGNIFMDKIRFQVFRLEFMIRICKE